MLVNSKEDKEVAKKEAILRYIINVKVMIISLRTVRDAIKITRDMSRLEVTRKKKGARSLIIKEEIQYLSML